MSDAPAASPAARFAKTDAGRTEIRNRALPLSRPARNLLLIIDASRTATEWLGLVQGCGPAELQALIDAGLVAPRISLAQALETKGLATLRQRVVAEAEARLGAAEGGRLIAEAGRCDDAQQMRALAQRFVERVRERQGDPAAMALAQALLAPG
jgi:hypothetical protein